MSLEKYQIFSSALKEMQQGNIPRAEELCNKIITQDPTNADALNLLGIMAKNQSSLVQAETYFQRGLEQHPKHIYLLNSMGALAKQLGDFEKAESCLQKAIKVKPDFVNALYNLSGVRSSQHQYPEAQLLLKQVLKLQPDNSEALGNLSSIEEKQNNLTLATQYAEKALALNPRNFIARLTLSNIHFRNENYTSAIEELIPTLNSAQNLTPINYSLAVGGIAQAYDKMKQYPQALDHYKKSNDALMFVYKQQFSKATSIYSPQNIIHAESCIAGFDFSNWKVDSETSYPAPVFLLGFPRSGTTLLDQMLASHSKITTLEEKETLYDIYSEYPITKNNLQRLATMSPQQLEKYRTDYWQKVAQYSDFEGGGILVDKLPLNSIMLIYIYRLFPNAKIIFAVRDPRDVVISCLQQRFSMNQAMFQFLDLETTVNYYRNVMALIQTCRQKFQLSIQLQKYEELILDFRSSLESLFDFIGVDWEDNVKNYRQKAQRKIINTPSNKQVVKPLYTSSISKWKNYAPYMKGQLSNLEEWVNFWNYE